MRNVDRGTPGWALVFAATSAGERTALAVDRDDPVAAREARRARPACPGSASSISGAPRSVRKPSVGMKLPSQSAPLSDASDTVRSRARAVGTLDVDRRCRSRPTPAAGASAGPASSRPARRRRRRPGRRRECPRRPRACPRGGAASSARCPGTPATYVPANSSTASSRLAIGPGGDDRDALADALPVERARQVGRRDRALALVEHLHVAAERNRATPPTRCGRGPKRRDQTTRPKPTEKRSTLTPHQRATT